MTLNLLKREYLQNFERDENLLTFRSNDISREKERYHYDYLVCAFQNYINNFKILSLFNCDVYKSAINNCREKEI